MSVKRIHVKLCDQERFCEKVAYTVGFHSILVMLLNWHLHCVNVWSVQSVINSILYLYNLWTVWCVLVIWEMGKPAYKKAVGLWYNLKWTIQKLPDYRYRYVIFTGAGGGTSCGNTTQQKIQPKSGMQVFLGFPFSIFLYIHLYFWMVFGPMVSQVEDSNMNPL